MKKSQQKVISQSAVQVKGKTVTSPPPPQQVKPFNVLDYAKDGITKDEVLEFKTAFDIFDPSGSGKVQIGEIKEAFVNLGFHHQGKFAELVLNHLEKKNNGVLDFGEFIRIATGKINEDFTLPQTNVVFSGFDPKGNGKFNVYDLKDAVRDLGQDLNDDEIERIFRAADEDNDGYVTTEDFYNIVTRKAYK